MTESLKSLERILNEQIKTYTDIAETIRAQQLLVGQGRYEQLAHNLEKQIALITRGKYLEQARIELIWEMADRGEIPRDDLTLEELIQHFGTEQAGSFHRIRSRLRAAVDTLRDVSSRNSQLLRVSLRAIDRMKSQLFGNNGQSYTAAGTAARRQNSSLVNRHG